MAEVIAALPDVQVAVANAGGLHLDQHLRARRLRRRLIDFLQRGVEIDDLETLHSCSPGGYCCSCTDFAMPVRSAQTLKTLCPARWLRIARSPSGRRACT